MLALIITALQLISLILDKITLLEKLKFFVSIKKILNATIKTANRHHIKKKKGRKIKSNSNKISLWLTIFCILNLSLSGFLFYKAKRQEKEINTLIVVTFNMLYNNKDFQNNLNDDKKHLVPDKNLADLN